VLQVGEFGLEGLHDLPVVVDELVALDVVEDLQDARGARGGTVAEFGIERDTCQALIAHRGSDLAFDERLGEHGQEVAGQQRFDAVRCFEVDRRDFLWSFEQVLRVFLGDDEAGVVRRVG